MSELYVESLHTYPVKSCAPVAMQTHEVSEHGLQYDREWMVARETQKGPLFITQRNIPELALVTTALKDDKLVITAPNIGTVPIPLERDKDEQRRAFPVEFFKKAGSAIFQSDEADDLLSTYLNKKVRLLRAVEPRRVREDCQITGANDTLQFGDGFPILAAASSSLNYLNKNGFTDIQLSMSRFRPNIVIGGDSEPFDEDYWRELSIGRLRAFVVRACSRCPIPDVNPLTGVRDPSKPASNALGEIRSGIDPVNDSAGVFFGENIVYNFRPNISVSVGDPVNVVDRSSVRNVELNAA